MSLFIGTVGLFNPTQREEEGLAPAYILNPTAGNCPYKRVISQTIFDQLNAEPGKAYLFSFVEGEKDPKYGRQWSFSNNGALTPMEVFTMSKDLGPAKIFGKAAVETGDDTPAKDTPTPAKTSVTTGDRLPF